MECISLEGVVRRDLNFFERIRGEIRRIWVRFLREKMKLGKMEGCLGDGVGGREEGEFVL